MVMVEFLLREAWLWWIGVLVVIFILGILNNEKGDKK